MCVPFSSVTVAGERVGYAFSAEANDEGDMLRTEILVAVVSAGAVIGVSCGDLRQIPSTE